MTCVIVPLYRGRVNAYRILTPEDLARVEAAVSRQARADAAAWSSLSASEKGVTWKLDADADEAIGTALRLVANIDSASLKPEQSYELYWSYITSYADARRELSRRTA